MSEKTTKNDKHELVKEYLGNYLLYKNMLESNELFSAGDSLCDTLFARAKMLEIKNFIRSLPPCREKMMLFYKYVRGETIERVGELLDVSPRTAFRIMKSATELAASHYDEIGKL